MKQPTIFTSEKFKDKMADAVVVQGKQFMKDEELYKIAETVVKDKKIELGPATVDFLIVYPNISKTVAGKCKVCDPLMKWFTGYDYIITVSGELWEMLDNQSKYILVWHELLHIDPVYDANKQEWKMMIRKHDFEDFYEIFNTHGLDWMETMKLKAQDLYDLGQRQKESVSQ